MRPLCKNAAIGASALLELSTGVLVHGFVHPTARAPPIPSTSLLSSQNDEPSDAATNPSIVAAASTASSLPLPSWYEQELLDYTAHEFVSNAQYYEGMMEDAADQFQDELMLIDKIRDVADPFEDEFLSSTRRSQGSVEDAVDRYPRDVVVDDTRGARYEEGMVEGAADQIQSGIDEEFQELCAISQTFDLEQANKAKGVLTKHHPKRHKHLLRYSPDISVACWLATVTNVELLQSAGFTMDDIKRLTTQYPKILKMDPRNLMAPKLRFLVNVLHGGSGDIGNGLLADDALEDVAPHNLRVEEYVRKCLPARLFFESRLETTMGPRHAYLALHGDALPHGKQLVDRIAGHSMPLLEEFLEHCTKKPADFARLCNKWQSRAYANSPVNTNLLLKRHTAALVRAMDDAFAGGLVPFARNQVTHECKILGSTPAEMMALLLDHGANYAEHDDWGSTALHWAAGTGNLGGMKALIKKLEQDEKDMEGDIRDVLWSTCASCYSTNDLATPLHWAAAGVNSTHFGCGGHAEVCRFLLDKAEDKKESLANAGTAVGNTPFMWACWSGSLDVAKLLVSEGNADPFACSDGGYTAAHWGASGGNVEICKYLHELGLKFVGEDAKNKDGDSPLDCAKSYQRSDVVEWAAKQTLEL